MKSNTLGDVTRSAKCLIREFARNARPRHVLGAVARFVRFLTKFLRKRSARHHSNRSFPQENVLVSLVLDSGSALGLGDLNVGL